MKLSITLAVNVPAYYTAEIEVNSLEELNQKIKDSFITAVFEPSMDLIDEPRILDMLDTESEELLLDHVHYMEEGEITANDLQKTFEEVEGYE